MKVEFLFVVPAWVSGVETHCHLVPVPMHWVYSSYNEWEVVGVSCVIS